MSRPVLEGRFRRLLRLMRHASSADTNCMALFEWDDGKYALGLPEMDAQHKAIFGILQELHQAMLTGKNREAKRSLLDRFSAYTETHRAAEERMLSLQNYSQLPEHRASHDEFSLEMAAIVQKHRSGKAVLTNELILLLHERMTQHVTVNDRQYWEELSARV